MSLIMIDVSLEKLTPDGTDTHYFRN